MRFLFIFNPASGGGRHQPRLTKALQYFRGRGDSVVVHATAGPGDGTRVVLARRFEGFDAVIAAGGDGTIHEVLTGLLGTSIPLGILPWGTGNVFAREMGLPPTIEAQCAIIRRAQGRALDLGFADETPFLLMASAGIDAFALGNLPLSRIKRLWGIGAYGIAALQALIRYRHPVIEVLLEDGTTDRGSFLLVSNTRLYGAFFTFLPEADPTDGYLNVLVFRDAGRWKFLGMLAQMAGRELFHRSSSQPAGFLSRHGVYRVKTLRVLLGHSLSVQVDGEYLPQGATSFSVRKGALKVLLP